MAVGAGSWDRGGAWQEGHRLQAAEWLGSEEPPLCRMAHTGLGAALPAVGSTIHTRLQLPQHRQDPQPAPLTSDRVTPHVRVPATRDAPRCPGHWGQPHLHLTPGLLLWLHSLQAGIQNQPHPVACQLGPPCAQGRAATSHPSWLLPALLEWAVF